MKRLSRREFLSLTAFGAGALVLQACSQAAPQPAGGPAPAQTTDAPKKLGGEVLTYSCTLGDKTWPKLVSMTKDALGADLKCLDMSTGEMIARVESEAGKPQADVIFGMENTSHIQLASKGLTESYKGAAWNSLPEHLKDPEGRWCGLYMGVIGIGYNLDRLKEKGVEAPASWQDLLNPKLEGEILMASPAASGTSYTILYSIVALMGEDKGFEYLKALDKNIAYYAKSSGEPPEKCAQGEFCVGFAFAHDIQTRQDKGLPIKIAFPSEGTGWEVGGISILKGAKNMEQAKAFVDFALTPAAQALHAEENHRIPVLPGVAVPPGNYTIDQVKIVPIDRPKMAAERTRLTEKWTNEIGVKR